MLLCQGVLRSDPSSISVIPHQRCVCPSPSPALHGQQFPLEHHVREDPEISQSERHPESSSWKGPWKEGHILQRRGDKKPP